MTSVRRGGGLLQTLARLAAGNQTLALESGASISGFGGRFFSHSAATTSYKPCGLLAGQSQRSFSGFGGRGAALQWRFFSRSKHNFPTLDTATRKMVPKEAPHVSRHHAAPDGVRTMHEWLNLDGVPMMARYLGVAGLVPFISLSGGSRPVLEAAVAYLPSGIGAWLLENADLLLVSYGACIASFLGGIHWGAAFAAGRAKDATTQLLWGVAPSVVAFPAVAMPAPWNIALLSNTLIVMVQADIFYAFKGNYPRNLVMLRMSLTLVAVASLIAALADDFQTKEALVEAAVREEKEKGKSYFIASRDILGRAVGGKTEDGKAD